MNIRIPDFIEQVVAGDMARAAAIIAEDSWIGEGTVVGVGDYAESRYSPKVYQFDLVIIGEHSVIPDHVKIGKNTAISGITSVEDYPDGCLAGGESIIKAGGVR